MILGEVGEEEHDSMKRTLVTVESGGWSMQDSLMLMLSKPCTFSKVQDVFSTNLAYLNPAHFWSCHQASNLLNQTHSSAYPTIAAKAPSTEKLLTNRFIRLGLFERAPLKLEGQ